MESLVNGFYRTGKSLETDATLRLSKRFGGDSNPNPKAFEDFGSSFATRSSQAPSQSKSKSRTTTEDSTRSICIKKPRIMGIKKPISAFYDSDDELDLLSSSQADPDDYQPSKKASVSKPCKYVDAQGKEHDYDSRFLNKSQVLSKLKFKKNKKLGGEDNTTMPSSSSLKNQPDFKENDQDFGSWVNDLKNKGGDNLPTGKCSDYTTIVDGHELFPLGRAKRTRTITKNKHPSRSSSPEISISMPKKKDGPSSQPLFSPENFPMDAISPLGGKVQKKPLPKPRNKVNSPSFTALRKLNLFPVPSPQSSDKLRTRVTSQSKGKNKAQPFPLDESDESEADEESECEEGRGKAKGKGKQKLPPSSPRNFPMDMISPLGGKKPLPKPRSKIKLPSFKASRNLKAFPMPSPQSSDKVRPKGKNKAPLSKPISEGLSDDEQQTNKKRRSSISPSPYSFEDEDDSITISPDTDPRTLCPYCDTPLPSSPSPFLVNILAATRKKSTRDPRPSNPLGLKAPLAIFIVACQRHKFENQILPEAERKGWPKTIHWEKLGARVESMRDELQALIEDPGGKQMIDEDIDEVERLFQDDSDGTRQKNPKARSIFWTEVMDEVKKKGSRAVVGVRGQFADFEKTQPGYYGEQGSVIIHQTLFDMFPPASFDPARISPLTSNEFVLRILVPEVALRLIMEDRNLADDDGMHQALIVLRESSAYGVAMFPEDGGEGSIGKKRRDDVMGVGDKIVMERARKRRKELEEEEEREERKEARRMAEVKEKVSSKKRKGKQREEQQLEVQEVPVERPRPRPRPIAKASSSMSIQPLSDLERPPQPPQPSIQHQSPKNHRRTRAQSRIRSIYSDMDTDSSDGFSSRPVMDLGGSDGYPPPTRAASRDLGVLNLVSDSDASLVSRTSTRQAMRRSLRKPAIERFDSRMDVDPCDDGDEDDVDLEVEDVLDIKTPTGKRSRSSNHIEANDASIEEETPKPLILPRTGESSNIKPLMIARMRRPQKNDSESKFGEADMPRRRSKLRSAGDERAPNLRASRKEDLTTDTEVEFPTKGYTWLLNDSSQSSMEGKSTSKRRQ